MASINPSRPLAIVTGSTDIGRELAQLAAHDGHDLVIAADQGRSRERRRPSARQIVGTLHLLYRVASKMRERDAGRILISGSVAGLMPGAYQAVYNGTKAFIDSFSFALHNELKDAQITVTCLMPGATETHFFERADMLDTKVGSGKKASPTDVAKQGYEAMKKGEGHVVAGWKNKVSAVMTNVIADSMLAEQHRKTAEPG